MPSLLQRLYAPIAGLALLTLISCSSSSATPAPAKTPTRRSGRTPTAIVTQLPPTFTPTPLPAYTPSPVPPTATSTPAPTDTPGPTATLAPTEVPPQGFLLWPFLRGTAYQRNDYLGRDSVFDRDRMGGVQPYDPSIPVGCSGGVCVVNNHDGIDIGVGVGTPFNSSADLTITRVETLSGHEGRHVGIIHVDYGNGYTGRYAHAQLFENYVNLLNEQGSVFVPACVLFGQVEESDIGAPHLHFDLRYRGKLVDPYFADDQYTQDVNPSGGSLWVGGEPQYCP